MKLFLPHAYPPVLMVTIMKRCILRSHSTEDSAIQWDYPLLLIYPIHITRSFHPGRQSKLNNMNHPRPYKLMPPAHNPRHNYCIRTEHRAGRLKKKIRKNIFLSPVEQLPLETIGTHNELSKLRASLLPSPSARHIPAHPLKTASARRKHTRGQAENSRAQALAI